MSAHSYSYWSHLLGTLDHMTEDSVLYWAEQAKMDGRYEIERDIIAYWRANKAQRNTLED